MGDEDTRGIEEADVQLGVIDTGKVSSARGLVLLGVESKGVHVNTISRGVGVVLIGLDVVEVVTFTDIESVMTVKLDQSGAYGVVRTVEQQTEVMPLEYADVTVDAGAVVITITRGVTGIDNIRVVGGER